MKIYVTKTMTSYSKPEKENFIESMKARTKKFAIDIIHFCDSLPNTQACRTISFQLIKAATSTVANYRASCRGRSQAEFYSKISITTEEADECQYWLELLDGTSIKCDRIEMKRLLHESEEILKICSTARKNSKKL
jgi:four helix bundle protein